VAIVAGDGPYLEWLQRFVRRQELDGRVRFLGRQPNSRIRELMAAADIVFLPSEFEGISLALFEAMAEGATVVGADVGGQRELVTVACGVLVERADEGTEVRRYAEVLAQLLDDPDRRRALGAAARERIREHFQLERMGETMDALLEEARERARSRPRPLPTFEEARAAAVAAIHEVGWTRAPAIVAGTPGTRLRRTLFELAARVGMPIHALAIRLGMHWVEGLRQRVAGLLQAKPN
jgi:glycosyl transferase family 1